MTQKREHEKVDLADAPWDMHEFFAGSGLVAYGLKGMFRPIWSNDICEKKVAVYNANFAGDHFFLGDIKNVCGTSLPYAHLSWASFPCQDLSLAGSMGGIDAQRSGLVWEWLRIVEEMPKKPKILVIENVVGLLTSNKGENYTRLHQSLLDIGYRSGAVVLDALLFVPQSRPRVFVIAVDSSVDIPEDLTNCGPNWLHNKAAASLGNRLPGWIWWQAHRPPKRRERLRDIVDLTEPYDKDEAIALIPPQHKKVIDVADSVIATGYRRTRNGSVCLELRFDDVAGCLRTPEGGSSKQFLIVKGNGETHARLLSPRETARLMGTPDSYALPDTYNDGYKAMGDAVAKPVASFVGESFLLRLAEAAYGRQCQKAS